MTQNAALISEADKLARVADLVTHQYAIELSRVLRDLERTLRTLAEDAVKGSRTALSRAVRASALRAQIREALDAAGYGRLTRTTASAGLDKMLAQVERLRDAAKLLAFTSRDMTRISALKDLATLDLMQKGDVIAHAVWRTFMHGLFSQRRSRDLIDDLADAIDVQASEARTLYDTTANIFGRQVEAIKTTPDDVYVYMGPADTKLRPFCHQRVGKVYGRPEIDAMDNGQIPNVLLSGGGYNCRHSWIAVSKLSELRALAGTGQRMPEIEDALQRVPVERKRAA
jgi:hypothetical protein